MSFASDMDTDQKTRDLAQRMVDEIARNEDFRVAIIDDPEGALERAGLMDDYTELTDEVFGEEDDVQGFAFGINDKLQASGVGDNIQLRPATLDKGRLGATWVMLRSTQCTHSGPSCG